MRKIIVLVPLFLILFAGFISAVAAGNVEISPQSPSTNDNLVCDVVGSSAPFVYKWYKNGNFYRKDGPVESATLSSSVTSTGEQWKCIAYTPGSYPYGGAYVGEDTVTISGAGIPTNHPPVLSPVGDKSICALFTLSFYLSATDPDGDTLTYSVDGPSGATICSFNGLFTWKPGCDQLGSHLVTFRVSDGKGGVDQETITITVNDCGACGGCTGNHPPVLDPIGDIGICAGETVTITPHAIDPDGDALTYGVSRIPPGATWNADTHTLTWTPSSEWIGTGHQVMFYVSDGRCGRDEETVTIYVEDCAPPENNCPVIYPIDDKSVCEGTPFSITVIAMDPDGDPLTYWAENLPSGASFNPSTHTFTWTPQDGQDGVYYVTFKVKDNRCCTVEKTVKITVRDCITENKCPVISPIGNKRVCEGSTLSFTVHATDPDGDALIYWAENLPNGASFNPSTHTFTWTPEDGQDGVYHVTFKVKDNRCCTVSETITIIVDDCIVNRPPVLDPICDQEVCEGELLQFCVSATDPDGDVLSYTATNLPSGATFNPVTRCFSWTPEDGQDGVYYVTFSVSDGEFSDSETVRIQVDDCIQENNCPCMHYIGPKRVCEGELLSFSVSASDIDGDALTYWAENIPSGAIFNPLTHTFTWTPEDGQDGVYYVTFKVSDGECVDSETVRIQVDDCIVNHPPVLDPIGDKTICEGDVLSFTVHGTDPDGDPVSYTVSDLPQGATFNSVTGVFYWDTEICQTGEYEVEFCVTDGEFSDCESIVISVVHCNEPPAFAIPDQYMNEGETLTLDLRDYSSDPDGDTLSFTKVSGVGAVSGYTYTYYADYDSAGEHDVVLRADDGHGGTAVSSFTIHVADTILPPNAEFTYTPSSPKVGQTVVFDGSLSTDPNGLPLTYQWDFNNDGSTDATGVIAEHVFPEIGNYEVRLTVSNGHLEDSTVKSVSVSAIGVLEIETIECFPVVIQHSLQSCSVTLDERIGDVVITLRDNETDEVLGTCLTDGLTGACTDNFPVNELGTFAVYATAEKYGYISDMDKDPSFSYRVIAQRYEIDELKVFNDSMYSNEDYDFFRAEDMYVRFIVRDMLTGLCTTDTVTAATLVSPPGGRADLVEFMPPSGCYYYYYLNIPPTHGFLGDSQVFTFAFNYSDDTGGEAYVDLVIRNNPPYISPSIPTQNMVVGDTLGIDLSSYKHDIEDSGSDLRWVVESVNNTMIDVVLTGDMMLIHAKHLGTTEFVLKLFDLDNDMDSQIIRVEIGEQKFPPVANPNGPYRGVEGEQIQFSSSGSYDPDGGELAYLWDFGDGTTSSEPNPVHAYTTNGTFIVTLTVTDDEGVSALATTHAYISALVQPELKLYRDDLYIKHLQIGRNNIVSVTDKEIPVWLTIVNRGKLDVKRMKLTVMVRELGLRYTFRNINIERDEQYNKYIQFNNPGIPGKYTLMLHLSADGVERTKFVEFEIK